MCMSALLFLALEQHDEMMGRNSVEDECYSLACYQVITAILIALCPTRKSK
jgi:hypothetical protein